MSPCSQISSFYYKTRAKIRHPAGHSWPAGRESEIPVLDQASSVRCDIMKRRLYWSAAAEKKVIIVIREKQEWKFRGRNISYNRLCELE